MVHAVILKKYEKACSFLKFKSTFSCGLLKLEIGPRQVIKKPTQKSETIISLVLLGNFRLHDNNFREGRGTSPMVAILKIGREGETWFNSIGALIALTLL